MKTFPGNSQRRLDREIEHATARLMAAQSHLYHAQALRAGVWIDVRKHARAKRVGVAPQNRLRLIHYQPLLRTAHVGSQALGVVQINVRDLRLRAIRIHMQQHTDAAWQAARHRDFRGA